MSFGLAHFLEMGRLNHEPRLVASVQDGPFSYALRSLSSGRAMFSPFVSIVVGSGFGFLWCALGFLGSSF